MYERLRVHESTLAKGEAQYQNRLEELRTIKTDLKMLNREKTTLSKVSLLAPPPSPTLLTLRLSMKRSPSVKMCFVCIASCFASVSVAGRSRMSLRPP